MRQAVGVWAAVLAALLALTMVFKLAHGDATGAIVSGFSSFCFGLCACTLIFGKDPRR